MSGVALVCLACLIRGSWCVVIRLLAIISYLTISDRTCCAGVIFHATSGGSGQPPPNTTLNHMKRRPPCCGYCFAEVESGQHCSNRAHRAYHNGHEERDRGADGAPFWAHTPVSSGPTEGHTPAHVHSHSGCAPASRASCVSSALLRVRLRSARYRALAQAPVRVRFCRCTLYVIVRVQAASVRSCLFASRA